MNMKKLILLLSFTFSVIYISQAEITFINGDIKAAKAKAAREGKLIFLEFTASYCTPCQMMEQYTFADPSVSRFVRENYVPVKVDIQSFDGYDLKNQYKISLLPTIIVLNSKGVQLGRHEETFTAPRFISVLNTYNLQKNKVKIERAGDSGYNAVTGYSNASSYSHQNNNGNAKMVSYKEPINTPKKEMMNAAPKNFVKTRSEVIYTVQVGAFSTKNDLNRAIEEIKKQFEGNQRMFVSERLENGKWWYRILVGHFSTRQQAASFLQSSGVKGFIRDLNSLKQ